MFRCFVFGLVLISTQLFAEADIESSIMRTKDSRMYHHAYLYYKQKSYSKAEKYVNQAIQENPIDHYKLLKARILLHKSPEALEDYVAGDGKSILDTELGLAIYASALNKSQRYELAAKVYQWLVSKDPENGRWWVGMALSYENIDRGDMALKMYQSAVNTSQIPTRVRRFAIDRINHLNQVTNSP